MPPPMVHASVLIRLSPGFEEAALQAIRAVPGVADIATRSTATIVAHLTSPTSENYAGGDRSVVG